VKKHGIFVAVIGFWMATSGWAAEVGPPPRDYAVPSPDGRYLFVMLEPREFKLEEKDEEKSVPHTETLREKYPSSGLYHNDGSKTPLWTVDWYANRVFVLSDGRRLIRIGERPELYREDRGTLTFDATGLAVGFYDHQKLVKRYSIDDLVSRPEILPHNHRYVRWLRKVSLDERSDRLKVSMEDGKTYIFSLESESYSLLVGGG
jgi:hypothetical protein